LDDCIPFIHYSIKKRSRTNAKLVFGGGKIYNENNKMRIPIVNEQDEVMVYKERERTTREDIRRIVSLIVFNEKGEVLIAKRQSNKTIDPDKWGPSVAGTVDEGESYDSTITKEGEEELGLKDIKPIFFKKYFYETQNARRFCSVYYITINSKERKFLLQTDEVAEIKWISIKDLTEWVNKNPEDFTQSFPTGSFYDIKEIYKILHENKN